MKLIVTIISLCILLSLTACGGGGSGSSSSTSTPQVTPTNPPVNKDFATELSNNNIGASSLDEFIQLCQDAVQ